MRSELDVSPSNSARNHSLGDIPNHPDIVKVAFTGSTQTGRSIFETSIADFKRVILEPGGKSPVILHKDADFHKAIPTIAMGCFLIRGKCVMPVLVFMYKPIFMIKC